MTDKIKIALVDDHILLRCALASVINDFDNCIVSLEASNGEELLQKLKNTNDHPDIVLLDLNMPCMNGFDTMRNLKTTYPNIHVLMLTMYDAEITLIKLLQLGVKGFLRKDIDPAELKFAIYSVNNSGFYYSNLTAGKLASFFRNNSRENLRTLATNLDDQQLEFLKHACSDMTYKEIAFQMKLSPRSIDGIRDQLFIKLDVKSRVGLALMAIKNGLVSVN